MGCIFLKSHFSNAIVFGDFIFEMFPLNFKFQILHVKVEGLFVWCVLSHYLIKNSVLCLLKSHLVYLVGQVSLLHWLLIPLIIYAL